MIIASYLLNSGICGKKNLFLVCYPLMGEWLPLVSAFLVYVLVLFHIQSFKNS